MESTSTATVMDGYKAWFICFSSLLTNLIVTGIHYSFAFFYLNLRREFPEYGRSAIVAIGSLSYGSVFLLAPVVHRHTLSHDQWPAVVLGCVCAGSALLLTSYIREVHFLFASHSLLFGIATSLAYTPSNLIANLCFLYYRPLASTLLMSSGGFGAAVMIPFTSWLFSRMGWREATRVLSLTVFLCTGSAITFGWMRHFRVKERYAVAEQCLRSKPTIASLFCNYAFLLWAAISTFAMFNFLIPYYFLLEISMERGLSFDSASHLLFFLGVATVFGRVAFSGTINVHWINKKCIQQIAMIGSGLCLALLPVCYSYELLLAYVLLAGVLDGCVAVLMPTVTVQVMGSSKAIVAWKLLLIFHSVPFAAGPIVAGCFRDTFGSHSYLMHASGTFQAIMALMMSLLPTVEDRISSNSCWPLNITSEFTKSCDEETVEPETRTDQKGFGETSPRNFTSSACDLTFPSYSGEGNQHIGKSELFNEDISPRPLLPLKQPLITGLYVVQTRSHYTKKEQVHLVNAQSQLSKIDDQSMVSINLNEDQMSMGEAGDTMRSSIRSSLQVFGAESTVPLTSSSDPYEENKSANSFKNTSAYDMCNELVRTHARDSFDSFQYSKPSTSDNYVPNTTSSFLSPRSPTCSSDQTKGSNKRAVSAPRPRATIHSLSSPRGAMSTDNMSRTDNWLNMTKSSLKSQTANMFGSWKFAGGAAAQLVRKFSTLAMSKQNVQNKQSSNASLSNTVSIEISTDSMQSTSSKYEEETPKLQMNCHDTKTVLVSNRIPAGLSIEPSIEAFEVKYEETSETVGSSDDGMDENSKSKQTLSENSTNNLKSLSHEIVQCAQNTSLENLTLWNRSVTPDLKNVTEYTKNVDAETLHKRGFVHSEGNLSRSNTNQSKLQLQAKSLTRTDFFRPPASPARKPTSTHKLGGESPLRRLSPRRKENVSPKFRDPAYKKQLEKKLSLPFQYIYQDDPKVKLAISQESVKSIAGDNSYKMQFFSSDMPRVALSGGITSPHLVNSATHVPYQETDAEENMILALPSPSSTSSESIEDNMNEHRNGKELASDGLLRDSSRVSVASVNAISSVVEEKITFSVVTPAAQEKDDSSENGSQSHISSLNAAAGDAINSISNLDGSLTWESSSSTTSPQSSPLIREGSQSAQGFIRDQTAAASSVRTPYDHLRSVSRVDSVSMCNSPTASDDNRTHRRFVSSAGPHRTKSRLINRSSSSSTPSPGESEPSMTRSTSVDAALYWLSQRVEQVKELMPKIQSANPMVLTKTGFMTILQRLSAGSTAQSLESLCVNSPSRPSSVMEPASGSTPLMSPSDYANLPSSKSSAINLISFSSNEELAPKTRTASEEEAKKEDNFDSPDLLRAQVAPSFEFVCPLNLLDKQLSNEVLEQMAATFTETDLQTLSKYYPFLGDLQTLTTEEMDNLFGVTDISGVVMDYEMNINDDDEVNDDNNGNGDNVNKNEEDNKNGEDLVNRYSSETVTADQDSLSKKSSEGNSDNDSEHEEASGETSSPRIDSCASRKNSSPRIGYDTLTPAEKDNLYGRSFDQHQDNEGDTEISSESLDGEKSSGDGEKSPSNHGTIRRQRRRKRRQKLSKATSGW